MAEHVLLVVSDTDTPDVIARIREEAGQYGECATLSKAIIAIKTRVDPYHLFEKLKQVAGVSDRIFLLPVKQPYIGPAPLSVRRWLHEASLH
jgi:hypothetical protein